MSIFIKHFLSRVKSRGVPERPRETATETENVPQQRPAEVEELARHSLKHSWRDDAKWLEENCEEFREAKAVPRSEQASNAEGVSSGPESLSTELRAGVTLTVELQGPCIAPGCPQSSAEALPASPPIQPLKSVFWQDLLYGNPDALISGSDATRALYLLSDKLGIGIVQGESIETLRAGAFRKLLRDRFGGQKAELAINELWRSAPASPGVPVPNDDQSHWSPGVLECPRSMADWRRDFHQKVTDDRRLLESMGGWAGG